MNIVIPTFSNPFSFHCLKRDTVDNVNIDSCVPEYSSFSSIRSKTEWSDLNHGQYIAVWHGNKWTRAVVSMESRVLFWLIDCGYFLRPEESTIYVPLSSEFKKLPSKVFEASIHGVVPIDKFLNETCEIENQVCMTWNDGAIHKGQNLITTSKAIYFVPIAIMSTKGNDVVLGDLYLEIPGEGTVNFIDLMELWPVFLQRNPEAYVKNLSEFYVSRRKHHACLLKPQMVPNTELPAMTLTTTLLKYRTTAESAPKLNVELDSESEDGSTVVNKETQKFRLTSSEIEEYSGMYFKESGKEINVLNMLINKTRDLIMCERYKDRKSVGRAFSRHRARLQDNTDLLDDGRYDDFEESFRSVHCDLMLYLVKETFSLKVYSFRHYHVVVVS